MDIIGRINNGEDSYTQFKENITNTDKLAEELVAFSNARGGFLIIGVQDNGNIKGLKKDDIHRLNQLIGNVINSNINPPIYPLVKIDEIDGKKIMVVEIDEGYNKPYSTNKGFYITKAGADKRKISSEELRRLFAESKRLYADEELVRKSDITDLNSELFYRFLKMHNPKIYNDLKSNKLKFETVLYNFELFRDKHLTLAGNLLFGLTPQQFSPLFYVDCVYFNGDDISVRKYVSKITITGTLEKLYNDSLSFLMSNLTRLQMENNFNSSEKVEIDEEVLGELIINALVHRDYFINSSIKIFIFHNRVEIINPGKLFNSLTVEKIKSGISIQRNPILNTISKTILPYSGYGSGIKRVLSINPNVELINDIDKEEFKCIIPRFT